MEPIWSQYGADKEPHLCGQVRVAVEPAACDCCGTNVADNSDVPVRVDMPSTKMCFDMSLGVGRTSTQNISSTPRSN